MITFDSKTHTYKIKEQVIPSVSEIVGVLDKGEGLLHWVSNQFYQSMEKQIEESKHIAFDRDVVSGMTQEAMYAWKETRDKSADIGTAIHKYCETGKKEKVDNPRYHKAIKAFDEWIKERKVKIIEREKIVYNEEWGYAGTLDALVEIDDTRYIIDYKTSSNVYPSHYIQVAGYMMAEDGDEGIIIHIDTDKGKVKEYNVPRMDYVFMSCVELYRGRQKLEDIIKKTK